MDFREGIRKKKVIAVQMFFIMLESSLKEK